MKQRTDRSHGDYVINIPKGRLVEQLGAETQVDSFNEKSLPALMKD